MRNTLQLIGETFREVCSDVWVKNAMKSMDDTNIIITDVRHENEMDAIILRNGVLILLGRTKYLNDDSHPSESSLKNAIKWFLNHTTESCVNVDSVANVPEEFQKFKYFIRNDGTLKELEQCILSIVKKIEA